MTIDQAADLFFKSRTDPLPEWLADKPQSVIDAALAKAAEATRSQATALITAIQQRDVQGMEVLLWPDNKTSAEIFTAITGIALPVKQSARREVLRDYCGFENWDRYYAAAEAMRNAESDRRKQEAAELEEREALTRRVRWTLDDKDKPQSGTVKEMIDSCFDHGYRVLTARKRGAFTDYLLGDGTTGYVFRRKLEIQYICSRLAELNAV